VLVAGTHSQKSVQCLHRVTILFTLIFPEFLQGMLERQLAIDQVQHRWGASMRSGLQSVTSRLGEDDAGSPSAPLTQTASPAAVGGALPIDGRRLERALQQRIYLLDRPSRHKFQVLPMPARLCRGRACTHAHAVGTHARTCW